MITFGNGDKTMTVITIRISEDIMATVKIMSDNLGVSNGEYIRRAIVRMNKTLEDEAKKEQLIRASYLVRENSMEVNAEFDGIIHEIIE
jgi:predicted DNA binding CopG/RHH family protein